MKYEIADFIPFSADAQRVAVNLEQGYAAWINARCEMESLPVSMYWQAKDGADYLSVKHQSSDSGSSTGPRDPQTQAQYDGFIASKADLRERVRTADAMIAERAGLYRRLRLPSIADQLAEILRTLDVQDMLGTDLLVVGANAFVAYQVVCAARSGMPAACAGSALAGAQARAQCHQTPQGPSPGRSPA